MLYQTLMKKDLGRPATWEEEFELLGADGVDFVPLTFNPSCSPQSQVILSLTKEQMLNGCCGPRTQYFFWKKIYGLKMYLVPTNEPVLTLEKTFDF